MNARTSTFRVPVQAVVWLLVLSPATSGATVVFDDHFEGNSGGVPVNWSGEGEGSIVEEGTTVSFYDEFVIWTNENFDPNATERTIIRNAIANTTNHTHVGLVDPAQFDNHIWIKLHALDGKIEVKASDINSGEEEIIVGYVSGYTGGAIQLTVVLESEIFSIATDTPSFSSGPISYTKVFTSFTRADLGNIAKLVLQNECEPTGPPCSSIYDRVTLEAGSTTSVVSETWGHIKSLYRQRT